MTSGSFVRIAYCRSSTWRLRTASGPTMNTAAARPVSMQLARGRRPASSVQARYGRDRGERPR